ncbi:LysR substrate-binding domain-containing protein [Nocardioides sp.]|uniref:LysR substrate-binding domain-containing protein n=1 Tax=Nocardioides sp. TaxID=35761 RepID=UPI00262BCF27|nr:LysR substrate-binding domain-containing protein [Nocardioides sp.]
MDTVRLLDGRLKLRHLLFVDALSEQGSVVGASAALRVTQPVVTRGLHELEEILGVKLYERGPRGITPTEFGEAFTAHARAVLAQLTQAARHVEELADAGRGQVVVGTHLAGSNLLIPRAIARLKQSRPGLTVIVREGGSDSLLVDLTAGRVDLIVGRLTGPAVEGTRRRALYDESIQFVVGHHHPMAGRATVGLSELEAFPWILPGTDTVLRQELEAFFLTRGFVVPSNTVETTSYLTVRQLLIETDMIAAMPSLIGSDDPRLEPLPLGVDVGHSVGVTLAAERRLSPATQAFVTALLETAKAMPKRYVVSAEADMLNGH